MPEKAEQPSNSGGVPSEEVGGRTMYVDNQGGLHTTAKGAIEENMRTESDMSRGSAGGCGQDPGNMPDGYYSDYNG